MDGYSTSDPGWEKEADLNYPPPGKVRLERKAHGQFDLAPAVC